MPVDGEDIVPAVRATSQRAAAASTNAGLEPARTTAGTTAPAAVAALAPAAGAAVFGLWAGTAAGGATAAGAIAGHLLLLAGALATAPAWRDPLALGRRGRLLPWALWLLAAASAWASPVPRAGRVAVVLLPAFVLAPAAVARAWRGAAGRRWGARGIAAVVAASAIWGLAGRLFGGDPRAGAPLGHHLLLAVWLLALLPVAVLPAVRDRGGWRALGALAALAGAAAVVATGSLAGRAGLALEAGLAGAVALRRWAVQRRAGQGLGAGRPGRTAVLLGFLALVLLAALAAPRLLRVGSGDDPSAQARWVYARAGLAGVVARPALGWGPGATPWTLARHLRPVPGVNPPGEVVAELHALPLGIAYELGLSGLLLAVAIAALFARRRLIGSAAGSPPADPAEAGDPVLLSAGLIGLAGAAVALGATAWLAVTALPVALALAAGAALAGDGRGIPGAGTPPAAASGGRGAGARWWRRRLPALVYCAAAAAVLAPLDLAHLAYDRALDAGEPEAERAALERAVELDPAFPLYRARRAWAGEGSLPDAEVAEEARRAAAAADGVAPLWLAAGVYGGRSGAPWAAAALGRACDLDPLGALAPFHRMMLDPAAPEAPAFGVRALLGEPRLAAATFWEGREELLDAALVEVLAWPGVDPGWREALVAEVTGWDAAVPGGTVDLGLRVDPTGADSLWLRAFRRRPLSLLLARVTLRRGLAEQVTVPPASALATTSPTAFEGPGCGPPPGRAAAAGGG